MDRTVRLWDLALERELVALQGFQESVNALAFAPDGRFLAVGCEDGVLDLRRAPAAQPGTGRTVSPSEASEVAELAADAEQELARTRIAFYETLWKMGRHREAAQAWQRLTPLLDKLDRVTPARAGQARQLASSLLGLSRPANAPGPPAAEEALQRAVRLRERLAAASPDVKSQEELQWALAHQGDFYRHRKRTMDAAHAYRRAVKVGERLAVEGGTASHRSLLAHNAGSLGQLLERDRPAEARRLLARAVALWEQLAAESPASTDHRSRLALALAWQGLLMQKGGQPKEAEAAYRRSITLWRRLRAELPGNDRIRHDLAATLRLLAALVRARDPTEAARLLGEAAALGK
jgi:tetratricopeptide (TPR) repeat protein